jgi:hypothetical protein
MAVNVKGWTWTGLKLDTRKHRAFRTFWGMGMNGRQTCPLCLNPTVESELNL